jgi:alpha-glucosidase
MHEFLREMNTEVLNKYDTVTIGELPHTPDAQHVLKYVGSGDKQLSMVFQFDIVDLGTGKLHKYDFEAFKLPDFKRIIDKWQTFIHDTDGWTTVFCENHDQGRSISRFANDSPEWREKSAKMLALAFCAMTGTLFIYQGQEIGMINVPREWTIDSYQDIESVNYYRSVAKKTNNDPQVLARVLKDLQILGRDNARVPMQWDDSEHAGFTMKRDGPWMRVNDSYKSINVASQLGDPKSVLNFWKMMLKTRKEYKELFIHGLFEAIDLENEETFVFTKSLEGRKAVIALNFTPEERNWGRERFGRLKLLVRSVVDNHEEESLLGGFEGRIYLLE